MWKPGYALQKSKRGRRGREEVGKEVMYEYVYVVAWLEAGGGGKDVSMYSLCLYR